jgi:hypothetical protein
VVGGIIDGWNTAGIIASGGDPLGGCPVGGVSIDVGSADGWIGGRFLKGTTVRLVDVTFVISTSGEFIHPSKWMVVVMFVVAKLGKREGSRSWDDDLARNLRMLTSL